MNHISYKELSNVDYKVYLNQKIKYYKKVIRSGSLSSDQQQRTLDRITLMLKELQQLQGQ